MTNMIGTFAGAEATVAAVAALMRDRGLTPDDVLREYDEWMAAQKANMIPAAEAPECSPSVWG